MQKMYAALESLMMLDPLLLTAFVYVCPKCELHILFEKIPSFFATSWLIKDVKDNRYFYRNDVSMTSVHYSWINFVLRITGRRSDQTNQCHY